MYRGLISIPESVNRRGSSGPTIGAIVRCSSVVAMARGYPALSPCKSVSDCSPGSRERPAPELELELPEGALVGDALEQCGPHRRRARGDGGQPGVRGPRRSAARRRRGRADPAGIGRLGRRAAHARHRRAADARSARRARPRPSRRRGRDVPGVTREVPELEYEAYAEMAERQIAEIVARGDRAPRTVRGAAEHRIGKVPLSEPRSGRGVGAHTARRRSPARGRSSTRSRRRRRSGRRRRASGCAGRRRTPRGLRELPAVHELAAALERRMRSRWRRPAARSTSGATGGLAGADPSVTCAARARAARRARAAVAPARAQRHRA